jgi:uncharacterized membrane protein YukC
MTAKIDTEQKIIIVNKKKFIIMSFIKGFSITLGILFILSSIFIVSLYFLSI